MEQEDRDQSCGEAAQPGLQARLSGRATVASPEADAENGVIGQQQWTAIHERRRGGQSVSAIARDMDLDRKTVRTALARSTWQPYTRREPPGILTPHLDWLRQRAPEVNYSASILHRELRDERGFAGCYELVKVAVRPLRAQASAAGLTQRRFETAPAEQAQVDWGQWSVHLGDQAVVVHVLVMTLGYSRRAYAEGFLNERMANVLAAHEHAFAHFGGRCESMLYDRMRTVVLGSQDGKVRLNPTFEAFARHWGFTPRLCQPYRAQTKGKVESGVKYLKRNFAPGRSYRDLEDFNTQLMAWQAQVADLRIHGTTHQRPIDRFADEAALLVPTAGHSSFLQAMVRDRVVAEDWLVSIDANRYSVPCTLIGRTVQVVREGGAWVIRHRGEVVARHEVLAGRAQLSVDAAHAPAARHKSASLTPVPTTPRPVTAPDIGAHVGQEVEVRDLSVYEQLALQEAA
jgi:transposase